jgi:hypothetical protein
MKALKSVPGGAVRHGVLPARYPNFGKILKDKYRIFGDSKKEFSCRRGWNDIVRIWLKITLTGDEVVEILEAVEIAADRQPRRIECITPAAKEIRWVEKPPLKLYRFKQIIETGFRFAGNLIVEKAEDLQQKTLKNMYPTLERLRTYYRQLGSDAAGVDRTETGAMEAEYRRRVREEIQYTRVKATLELIAVETISTPVLKLTWLLQRNGNSKEVTAVANLHDGSLISPVRCDICDGESWSFGISDSNMLVCETCHALCDICGAEIVDRQVSSNHICSICHRIVCNEHAMYCESCRQLVCRDHQIQCKQGCRICPNCIRYCNQCGETIIWCNNHVAVNFKGDISCRNHTVFCIGCHENFPVGKTESCTFCGQKTCFSCLDYCIHCGRNFCLSHIEEGMCDTCRKTNSQMILF